MFYIFIYITSHLLYLLLGGKEILAGKVAMQWLMTRGLSFLDHGEIYFYWQGIDISNFAAIVTAKPL